jgi:hypothetical protein
MMEMPKGEMQYRMALRGWEPDDNPKRRACAVCRNAAVFGLADGMPQVHCRAGRSDQALAVAVMMRAKWAAGFRSAAECPHFASTAEVGT